MGIRSATRSQMLVALRRWMPNASLRRLGDMVSSAKLVTVQGKAQTSATLAFGLVVEGTLRVAIDGETTRWVGPGDVFGMSQYEQKRMDSSVLMTGTTKSVRYLAFSHADLASLGFVRPGSLPV